MSPGPAAGATIETIEHDEQMMLRALDLAARGWGRVAPNPMVGALVARGGEILGEGWHAELGGDHAEIAALRAAGEGARGATLYTTLEPCTHHGRTPPCCDAILEAAIGRVVIGWLDPDPVAAGGATRLREAGVEVSLGPLEREARELIAPFLWRRARRTPYTAVKLAISLDGRISAGTGVRTAVTGEEAGNEVQRLRAGYSGILVGRATAQIDDPQLTARGPVVPRVPPVRIVIDPGARLDPESRLGASAPHPPVWLLVSAEAPPDRIGRLEAAGVRTLETPIAGEGLDLEAAWRSLAEEGLDSLLVEGGGRTVAGLLEARLVQRIYLFVAPVVFGEGPEAFAGSSFPRRDWRVVRREAFGDDTLIVLDPVDDRVLEEY